MAESQSKPTLRWMAVREALADFWRDYHWPTKLTLALILISCVWGMAVAGWPELDASTPPWVRALASDAFRTILTFIIALLIAVNFYMRARRGVLDGDEHYNIARALAFGYFKNFLVPALKLSQHHEHDLQVFRPATIEELRDYSRQVEPVLRQLFEHEWLPVVEAPEPGGPPRRTVLALQAPKDPKLSEERAFFFDAPTALFTVSDFYNALNRRRVDDGKEPISAETVTRYQNGQIDSFFQHLRFLFRNEAGLEAVSDIVSSPGDLAELRHHLQAVSMEELRARYLS